MFCQTLVLPFFYKFLGSQNSILHKMVAKIQKDMSISCGSWFLSERRLKAKIIESSYQMKWNKQNITLFLIFGRLKINPAIIITYFEILSSGQSFTLSHYALLLILCTGESIIVPNFWQISVAITSELSKWEIILIWPKDNCSATIRHFFRGQSSLALPDFLCKIQTYLLWV